MKFKIGDCVGHLSAKANTRFWVYGYVNHHDYSENVIHCLVNKEDFKLPSHPWRDDHLNMFYTFTNSGLPTYFKQQFSTTWCFENNLYFHPDPISL